MLFTSKSFSIFDDLADTLLSNEVESLKKKWNFELAQSLFDVFKTYCKAAGDYEVYHLYMNELREIFFTLPLTKKWEAFSLMLDHQTDGGVANEFNRYFEEKVAKAQMLKILRSCKDKKTRAVLEDYLKLLYK
jgi:hypothetical protein